MDIEKNDVIIKPLFDYKTKIGFTVDGKEIPIYIRLIGDADFNKARVRAIRDVTKLRENLENPEWEDRVAYIPNIKNKSKEEIVDILVLMKLREIGIKVTLETQSNPPFPYPSEPKAFAPVKEQEDFQKEVDSFPEKIREYISSKIKKETDALKQTLLSKTEEELRNSYNTMMVEEICESYFKKRLEELVVFFSLYKDESYKEKLFKDNEIDEFDNLPTHVREKLMNAYDTIDLPGDELKKSQGAMR